MHCGYFLQGNRRDYPAGCVEMVGKTTPFIPKNTNIEDRYNQSHVSHYECNLS